MDFLPLYLLKRALRTPKNQLFKKVARGIRHYVFNYPVLIVLQTVEACNLQCSHCFINNYGREITDGKKKILSFDEFRKRADRLAPLIKHAEYFSFSTFEASIHKNIFEMFDYILAINPAIKFPILTNTMAIDYDFLVQMRNYPISEFTVSLDGLTRETVENFKTGVSYDKIIEVMEQYNSLDFDAPMQAVFVMHKNNYRELPDYVDFLNKFGVRTIFVNNLLSFTPDLSDLYLYSPEGSPEAEAIIEETKERILENGQQIFLPLMKPEPLGCRTCEYLFIDINGDVCPCDFLSVSTPFEMFGKKKTAKPVKFGNIMKANPHKIFNSKRFKQFRDMHRKGYIPKNCELCIDAYGLMCSNRKPFGKNIPRA